jgi:hypothetical protein
MQCFFKQLDLRSFAAAVDSFDGNEFSWRNHVRRPV